MITPTEKFFNISYSHHRPTWTHADWQLKISGLIEEPTVILNWDSLQQLPATDIQLTLQCLGNRLGGNLIGNAIWKGVRFAEILKTLTLKPNITRVRFAAWDGYQTAVDLKYLLHPDTLLAYEMNGAPLSMEHGFPVRILIPELYAQKMPKWIQRIEFIAYDFKGYWEQRGWSDTAELQPTTVITAPASGENITGATRIMGYGLGKVDQVYVRIDGGEWLETELEDSPHPYRWRGWHLDWEPTHAGQFSLEARPNTSSAIHQIIVQA